MNNGKAIQFSTDKSRALLVYLAVEAGRAFRRSHLAGLLWSEFSEEQGLHNLRQTLSLLRKAWEELQYGSPLLLAERDTIQLNPQVHLQVDVCAFDETLNAAYRFVQNRRGLAGINIRCLIKAVALFGAPFLDRFELDNSPLFDEWAISTRERTNQAALGAMAVLCEYYERRGEYSMAGKTARRMVELDPWDESAHSRLMRILAVDHQWSAAQNQYIQLKQVLKRNLNVDPDPETTALYNQIRSHAAGNRPFTPQFPVSAQHLPAPSEFIGREMELDEIAEEIANPQIRLITITGLGGIGKTRLALEVGRMHVGLFTGGVFFIPFLNVTTPETFVSAFSKGLGLQFVENKTPQAQILDYLREKQVLLILDNFEHLVEEAQNLDFLVEILEHAPGVKILVTSRERLNLRQEHRFVLEGLRYPPDGSERKQPDRAFDAVAWFEVQARKMNRHFRVSPENSPAILKICNLTQGHPLAIELITSLSPHPVWEDLLAQFVDSLHDLKSQFANAPAQHKTLRAVFDASWKRLTPGQQRTLSGLALCRGGFTYQAAGIITEASAEFLDGLVGKSLLRQDQAGRFEFHEAVRQYAEEKLVQSPYASRALDVFTGYFSQSLEKYAAATDFSRRIAALNWIDLEFDNLRSTWDHLIKMHCTVEITSGVDLLYQFFNIRSRFTEGITWLQAAVTGLSPFPPDNALYGMLKTRIGSLALRARDIDLAFESLSEGRKIFSRCNDRKELAFCLIGLGGLHLRKKAYPEAQACAQESLAYYRELKDFSGQSYAHYLAGLIHSRLGNYPAAKEALNHALTLGRQVGDRRRLIAPLNVLGDTACTEGDFDQAEIFFLEALEISRELNDRFNLAILLNNLASIYQDRRQYVREESVLLESLEICRDIGDRDGEAFALNSLGEMAVVQEKYREALDYSTQALKIAEQFDEDLTIIVCLNNIGEAYAGLQNYSEAGKFFQSAAWRSLNIDAMSLLARAAINAASVFFFHGEKDPAANLLQAALAHSATEFDTRQKAAVWMKKMDITDCGKKDDSLLPDTIQRVFPQKKDNLEILQT